MIWLAGAKGMLGKQVMQELSDSGLDVLPTDVDVDITDSVSCQTLMDTNPIQWIINCAAYTAVDRAEDEPEKAFHLNADGPKNLARLADRSHARLIHLSTDYVFRGDQKTPRSESDPPHPLSVYGISKLKGERCLLKECPQHFIIRTAWMYGTHGSNFVYTMLKLMHRLDEIKVVDDQTGSPTCAKDLAGFIGHLIRENSQEYGIYHYTNSGYVTWFEFAKKIYALGKDAGLLDNECRVIPCTSAEFPAKAVRPKYSLLSKAKIRSVFDIVPPQWDQSLKEFILALTESGYRPELQE